MLPGRPLAILKDMFDEFPPPTPTPAPAPAPVAPKRKTDGLALLLIVMYRPAGIWPWLAARLGIK